ncbi:DUF2889 domain-containing protein [Polaromonas hydrogenivorans]|uniref:DUF2889 domain-containing protein n=1 Tax=Polaromonas hydrogenivorans TaxID=335476 RepID=A0AAU7LYH5_9BURK
MPLSKASSRREVHHRVIDMRAYARDDGLYDVEAHLVDLKPFTHKRFSTDEPTPAGQPMHDLWVRITLDGEYVVRQIEAAADVTPFAICKEAESTLSVLVGERIARGWSSVVKERLRGAASCNHLMELLIPLATTAMQGIVSLNSEHNGNKLNAKGVPVKIDSCYAYGRQREVVQRLWPQHYQSP